MNILVSTFGQTWPIAPELLGLTNPASVPLFRNYPYPENLEGFRAEVHPVDELWLIITADENSEKAVQQVLQWEKLIVKRDFVVRSFPCPGTSQLADALECRKMTDFIFRVVLHASEAAKSGALYLSLAGGRKTMSADMQKASWLFGCEALFHVADNLKKDDLLKKWDLTQSTLSTVLTAEAIAPIFPVIVARKLRPDNLVSVSSKLQSSDYPVENPDGKLVAEIEVREKSAQNLMFNSYLERNEKSATSYFHGLQLLPAERINQLQTERIGINPANRTAELAWLRSLPKADLHCHLGGILDASGMIETALANMEAIDEGVRTNIIYNTWLLEHQISVKSRNREHFSFLQFKGWEKELSQSIGVIPHLLVTGLLSTFDGHADFLDEILFGNLVQENEYCKISLDRYMLLGDLQGSALLCKACCLKKCLQILKDQCSEDHVTYCEVRCSPANYASDELDANGVLDLIISELSNCKTTRFRLIIIASRHGDLKRIEQHVEMVTERKKSEGFTDWFAGFDLAGDEAAVSPGKLHKTFAPLLEDCINITIHAGEVASVENVWQAVYLLNADRIGHGLRLIDNPKLTQRFADRGISLELCPSSNFQTVGFRDNYFEESFAFEVYPLRNYFDLGIQITINTDNPGISRTTLSNEYIRAARLTPGGLSKWEVLQLIRNSFKAVFCRKDERKALMLKAEGEILKLLMQSDSLT